MPTLLPGAAFALCLGIFAYVWVSHLTRLYDWHDYFFSGLITFGDDCQYATGPASGVSPDQAIKAPHDWLPTKLPYRGTDVAPDVNQGEYLLVRCSVDLTKLKGSTTSWIWLGEVYGQAYVYLNGHLKQTIDDNGRVEFPVLEEEKLSNAELAVVALPIPGQARLGPAQLLPPFITTDRREIARVNSLYTMSYVEFPVFRVGFLSALAIIFGVAWAWGIRYTDVQWMIVTLAAMTAFYIPELFQDRVGTEARDALRGILSVAMIVAAGAFFLAFLRKRRVAQWLQQGFLVTVATYTPTFFSAYATLENKSLIIWYPHIFAGVIVFAACGVLGLRELKDLPPRRRSRVILISIFSLLAAVGYAIQIPTFHAKGTLYSVPLIFAIITCFAAFLAEDLVIYHRRYMLEQAGRERLQSIFRKYVPRASDPNHLEDPTLGGEVRQVIVMVLDIREFTALSLTLSAKKTITLLNRVFAIVNDEVKKSGGYIDKYLGDGVLAIWNYQGLGEEITTQAVNAAKSILVSIDKLNEQHAGTLPPVQIGIGMHRGEAVVGNIGTDDRMEFTCIGLTVNVASRLEGLNKTYNTRIILSDAVYRDLDEPAGNWQLETDVQIRGVSQPMNIAVWNESVAKLTRRGA